MSWTCPIFLHVFSSHLRICLLLNILSEYSLFHSLYRPYEGLQSASHVTNAHSETADDDWALFPELTISIAFGKIMFLLAVMLSGNVVDVETGR